MNKGRIAGIVYLITFIFGVVALVSPRGRVVANVISTASYAAVTILFYDLFKPISRGLSLFAAVISLLGLAVGALNMLHLSPVAISPLVFFGFYCVLVGYLIFESRFMPRTLGVLLAIGGLGWLTFASPELSKALAPYNLAPGMIGEGILTVWLLAVGVNRPKWEARARATGMSVRAHSSARA
jgi:uncharacterized protein DUF4386